MLCISVERAPPEHPYENIRVSYDHVAKNALPAYPFKNVRVSYEHVGRYALPAYPFTTGPSPHPAQLSAPMTKKSIHARFKTHFPLWMFNIIVFFTPIKNSSRVSVLRCVRPRLQRRIFDVIQEFSAICSHGHVRSEIIFLTKSSLFGNGFSRGSVAELVTVVIILKFMDVISL